MLKLKSKLIITAMVFAGMTAFISCEKDTLIEPESSSFDYYKGLSEEEIIEMYDHDLWYKLYKRSFLKTKPFVVAEKPETVEIKGRYVGRSDDGGIICNREFPDEICYTIHSGRFSYQIIYAPNEPIIIELD